MKTHLISLLLILSINAFSQTADDFYNNGSAKANAGDLIGAIKDFDKAISVDQNFSPAYYNRGTAKLMLNENEAAIKDFNKAISLKPDYSNAYSNRGVARMKLGENKNALEDLNNSIKLDQKNVNAYFMRGQLKLQMDDVDGGCADLAIAKENGDKRADKFIQKYCDKKKTNDIGKKGTEYLMIDWPDSEGWKVANEQDNSKEKMIELLRNNETFENWTEIGTMFVYKTIRADLNIPLKATMDYLVENSKKSYGQSVKATLIEKDENAKFPWIIFKIECSSSKGTESQVWYAIQGTDEMFVNFRAIKQGTIPQELQDKWVKFFKSSQIVIK